MARPPIALLKGAGVCRLPSDISARDARTSRARPHRLAFPALISLIFAIPVSAQEALPTPDPAPPATVTVATPPPSPTSAGLEPVVGPGNLTESAAAQAAASAAAEAAPPIAESQYPAAVPVDRTLRVLQPVATVVSAQAMESLDPKSLRLVVSLEAQTAWLYSGQTVVIQTPVSTGRRTRATARGSFKVTRLEPEALDPHFGNFVDSSDRIVRESVDARYDYAPAGSRFQSAPKQDYIEFDPDKKRGFVAGDPPGYRSTSGDIILPRRIAALIFSAVEIGTPVEIQP